MQTQQRIPFGTVWTPCPEPDNGFPILVDLRSTAAYRQCHIDRSFSLPFDHTTASRADFPWSLLPDRQRRFSILVDSNDSDIHSLAEYFDPGPDFDPSSWDFDGTKSRAENLGRLLHSIVASGWTLHRVYVAMMRGFWSSCLSDPTIRVVMLEPSGADQVLPELMVRGMRLPFDPSPAVAHAARLLWGPAVANDEPPPRPIGTVLDLGCGAGRDLAWLAHTYAHLHGLGLDAWKGSVARTEALANRLQLSDRVHAVRAELRSHGRVHPASVAPLLQLSSASLGMPQPPPLALVLMHRYLPPRTSAAWLRQLVPVGAALLVATFELPRDMSLDAWVAEHQSPTHHGNLLVDGELTRDASADLVASDDRAIVARIGEWGWGFTAANGFETIMSRIVMAEDGQRPIRWLLTRRVLLAP